ncbi:hypothetical protein [Actinotalea fermentans]|uniref:Uncharacterized protein n=1 Tax=Actinotalea fermentans TaxID=43671 RepID=A0A511Z0B1_9CELL|nr:hypothetical protein [Actinotalea fermentans]GEN80901.1 hypothetical protein AFE02nite_26350 [Actinotalea fermentans]
MTSDPFFDELRRRLPGVRIVVLPGGPDGTSAPEPPQPVPDVDLATAATRASRARADALALLRDVWPTASAGAAPPQTVQYAWQPDPGAGEIVASVTARLVGLVHDVRATLLPVAETLDAAGWQVVARPVGHAGARLHADRGDQRLDVVAWGPDGPWDVTAGATAAVGQHAAAVSATGTVDAGWHDDAPEVAP